MKRGYRLNSTAAFSRYAQARQANFAFGSGLLKAGVQKVDDGIRAVGQKLSNVGVNRMGALEEAGKAGGLRTAGYDQLVDVGTGIDANAKRIRNGLGIAGGLGAVGLGGAALANRQQQQQPRMY